MQILQFSLLFSNFWVPRPNKLKEKLFRSGLIQTSGPHQTGAFALPNAELRVASGDLMNLSMWSFLIFILGLTAFLALAPPV